MEFALASDRVYRGTPSPAAEARSRFIDIKQLFTFHPHIQQISIVSVALSLGFPLVDVVHYLLKKSGLSSPNKVWRNRPLALLTFQSIQEKGEKSKFLIKKPHKKGVFLILRVNYRLAGLK